jgi:tetratricopeptide (TPR) repeat protein
MKSKAVYDKVRKLIDERELDGENLDWAEDALAKLLEKEPECAWAYGLVSEIYYWRGEVAPAGEKLALFQDGVDFGEQGTALDENCLEANFWLAVNYGFYGQEKGIMQSLALINPMRECLERAQKVDETYFYGGPWRALGRLYHKAPGWPVSCGNLGKGVECLEKAIALGPRFYLNRIYLAEAYAANRKREQAREQLEWVINAPLSPKPEREDEGYKDEARILLQKLG